MIRRFDSFNRLYGKIVPAVLCALLSAGCAFSNMAFAEALTEASSEAVEDVSEAATEAAAEDVSAKVATASEMTAVDDVLEDWMVPIYPEDIEDGVYDVDVNSSSSMFSIESCILAVTGDKMSAAMTMGGTGYLYVYPGTPEEAAAADEEDCISFEENADGAHTFTIPVEALDAPVKCAAYSKKKEKWYDRTLVFVSTSLPAGTIQNIESTSLEDLNLADGTYLVDVRLSGGSGKASVESPAQLTVEDGAATLYVTFSSPHYDYVLVGEDKYLKTNEEGNSVFAIPVDGFDYEMPITADTTAMSKPHEINYTLHLDSASIEEQ